MASKPRHIGRILQHQDALASLYQKIRQQQDLLAVVRGELPKPLGEHCLSAVLDGAILALSTDSPVWSAKLRFHTPRLLSQLRKAHPGIANIRIRVAGNRLARATPARRPPRGGHSDLAASIVARAASDTSDSTLRQALQRLAKAMREN
jgi:hypothetical protein